MVIPVPALVEEARYDAVHEQLAENRRRARLSAGSTKTLSGLAGDHDSSFGRLRKR